MRVKDENNSNGKCHYIHKLDLESDIFTEIEQNNHVPTKIPDPEVATSKIFKQWYNFIRLLRVVGSCPLALTTDSKNQEARFEFKLFSWTTLYGVILGVLRLFICLAYYKNWGISVLGRR